MRISGLTVALLAASLVCSTASAATINFSGGKVTGIDDLDVGGTLIDVAFFGPSLSYNGAYGNADVGYANGVAIRDAITALLNAQLPVPDIFGTSGAVSGFTVPTAVGPTTFAQAFAVHPAEVGAFYVGLQNSGNDRDFVIDPSYLWLRVLEPPTATPIPGTLPLFATGLAGFGFLAHRRKRKQAA